MIAPGLGPLNVSVASQSSHHRNFATGLPKRAI
jgi:hypothetical protein